MDWLKLDLSSTKMGGEYVTKEDWLLAGGGWHIADKKAWSLKIAVIKNTISLLSPPLHEAV